MICQLEDSYTLSIVWFVYQQSVYQASNGYRWFSLAQNGQNLQIRDMHISDFYSSVFECRLLASPTSNGSIPISNFTTVVIPGIYLHSMIVVLAIVYDN